MAPRAASFSVGDVVTLKGQAQVMTVIPLPEGKITAGGWVHVAHSHTSGLGMYLLPAGALTKKPARK